MTYYDYEKKITIIILTKLLTVLYELADMDNILDHFCVCYCKPILQTLLYISFKIYLLFKDNRINVHIQIC